MNVAGSTTTATRNSPTSSGVQRRNVIGRASACAAGRCRRRRLRGQAANIVEEIPRDEEADDRLEDAGDRSGDETDDQSDHAERAAYENYGDDQVRRLGQKHPEADADVEVRDAKGYRKERKQRPDAN